MRTKSEIFNSLSHLIGAFGTFIGTIVLLKISSDKHDPWRTWSILIYGIVTTLLFSSSALYHGWKGEAKKILQKVDHIAIYLKIAGSYTPFMLIGLRDGIGWPMLIAVWCLSLVGITYELTLSHKSRIPSLLIYLVMAWLALLAVKPLTVVLGLTGMYWMYVGGACYMLGLGFYLVDEKHPAFHPIWHCWVLAGTLCHYMCIFWYLA